MAIFRVRYLKLVYHSKTLYQAIIYNLYIYIYIEEEVYKIVKKIKSNNCENFRSK